MRNKKKFENASSTAFEVSSEEDNDMILIVVM